MRLSKITLTNFRCFKQLELELHPRLTVLVGENGVGKTALLDGIAIGLSPILRNLSSANQRLTSPKIKDTDFYQIFPNSRGNPVVAADYVQVSVEAESGLKWDISESASKSKSTQPPSKIGESGLNDYLSGVLDSLKTSHPKLVPVMAYYGARRGWVEVPGRLHESKNEYDYPTSALIDALDSLSDFKEMLKWFDFTESSELRANVGNPPEEHIEHPNLSTVRSAIESILNYQYTNPRFDHRHKFVLNVKNGSGVIQISQLSQGYQSMLALGMDFARRLALANPRLFQTFGEDELFIIEFVKRWNPGRLEDNLHFGSAWAPAVMLIDEIDLHLHPSWQQKVLDDLLRTFPATQFIVTTHSPQVLSTVKKESIRVIKMVDGNPVLLTPQFQTRGVESAEILAEIMDVDPVPRVEESIWLNDYRALIDQGLNDTSEGLELRSKLLNFYGELHPIIRDCDRLIRFQSFKRRTVVNGTH